MTDTSASAPDLKDGAILNGPKDSNIFRTNIECALERRRKDGKREFSYLANECRAERVGREIFDTRMYEVCIATTWDGPIRFASGSYNYSLNPLNNSRDQLVAKHVKKWNEEPNIVKAPDRPIRLLSFDEALDFVRNADDNHIYMKIDWKADGSEYSLYTPCRYSNFSNPDLIDDDYIQPISGYVLTYLHDRFYMAYVAAHVKRDGVRQVEFMCRDQLSYLGTKPRTGRFAKIFSFIDKCLFRKIFVTDEFHKVVVVDGACTFYTYADS